jgi:hypothetical protein
MSEVPSLAAHLGPNTIRQLEQAAEKRYEDGESLRQQNRLLAAIYLYGYSVEMCLTAAYFRSAGFHQNQVIDDHTRRSKMKEARGMFLMTSDAHPLVGWARLLEWHRRPTARKAATSKRSRLQEAVEKAERVYKHWRPELRYKLTSASVDQVIEVRLCVHWFLKQRGRLSEESICP